MTHYLENQNDMANEDKELLSLRSEVELDDAVDSIITSRCMAPAMPASKRIAWTHFRNTRKNVQVSTCQGHYHTVVSY